MGIKVVGEREDGAIYEYFEVLNNDGKTNEDLWNQLEKEFKFTRGDCHAVTLCGHFKNSGLGGETIMLHFKETPEEYVGEE